jgi:flagellar biosynthesis/type III secretory pathway chaperone
MIMTAESTARQLIEALSMELELAVALRDINRLKQKVILALDGSALAAYTERELEILRPLEAIEKERVKLSTELGITAGDGIPDTIVASAGERAHLAGLTRELRAVVGETIAANGVNKTLLEHSREFIRESLRLVTGNFALQLVDRKG